MRFLVSLLLSLCLVSCNPDSFINPSDTNQSSQIVFGEIRGLTSVINDDVVLSDVKKSSSNHSRTIFDIGDYSSLFFMEDGLFKPLVFSDTNGNDVVLNVSWTKQVNESLAVFRYDGEVAITYDVETNMCGLEVGLDNPEEENSEDTNGVEKIPNNEPTYETITVYHQLSGQGLIDFSTNRVFDFSNYDIENFYYRDGIFYLLKDRYYSHSYCYKTEKQIVKFDVATGNGTVIATNDDFRRSISSSNSSSLHINELRDLQDNWLIVDVKIDSFTSTFSVDLNGIKPITNTGCVFIDLDVINRGPYEFANSGIEYSHLGDYQFIDGQGTHWYGRLNQWNHSELAVHRLELDENGQLYIPEIDGVQEVTLEELRGSGTFGGKVHLIKSNDKNAKNRDKYYIPDVVQFPDKLFVIHADYFSANDFITIVTPQENGGLTFEYVECDTTYNSDLAPDSLNAWKRQVVKDNCLFWIDSGSKKIKKLNLETGEESIVVADPVYFGSDSSLDLVETFLVYKRNTPCGIKCCVYDLKTNKEYEIDASVFDIQAILNLKL